MTDEKPPPLSRSQGNLAVGDLPVRITSADFARLIGCTSARVCQMKKSGLIPVAPNGRIDPSAAITALIRKEREGAQLRVLPELREKLRDADERVGAALAAVQRAEQQRDQANEARLAAERDQARLARIAVELEYALELLRPTAGNRPVDRSIERAMNAALARMAEAQLDPDLLSKAAAAEPTAEQRIDALALRVEQAEATDDPSLDRLRADLSLARYRAQRDNTTEAEDDD